VTHKWFAAAVLAGTLPLGAQQAAQKPVPVYRVTVVERNLQAVNYQYRSDPTRIDFRGTVLLPDAEGEATIESKQGRIHIDAEFEDLAPPTRFGREYLTYVLWAVSPEGSPHNLGEVIPDASNDADLEVTTELQAFGLIVTAEPYSAVRQPSDVVVLQNEVRSDTVGKVEPIQVKYELMPRGHYTWNVQEGMEAEMRNLPKVSMDEYEAVLEVYQAQNAVGIAGAASAAQYAPNTYAKAQQLLAEARRLQEGKADRSLVVQSARAAAQTAEDARTIAERRRQEETLAKAHSEADAARQAKERAEAEAQRAQAEASAARAQAEAERAARMRAEAAAAQARAVVPSGEAARSDSADRAGVPEPQESAPQGQTRMRLIEELNSVVAVRDTPRGLVVTIPDAAFNGAEMRTVAAEQVAQAGAILAGVPGLRLEVEGHSDSAATAAAAASRADAVREMLGAHGIPGGALSARGFADSRPSTSNLSEAGKIANRRVEIVISGEAIGTAPFWDRTYQLNQR
jgi:flagellar motor protein MotB